MCTKPLIGLCVVAALNYAAAKLPNIYKGVQSRKLSSLRNVSQLLIEDEPASDKLDKLYEGAEVWQTNLSTPQHMTDILKLEELKDISIWRQEGLSVDYLVLATSKSKVQQLLRLRNLDYSVLIPDVQRRVDAQRSEVMWNEESLRNGHRLDWKSYPPLQVIEEYLAFLQENYPSLCKVTIIGKTAQKRPISMLKISTNENGHNNPVLLISGVHGREWVGVTSLLYLVHDVVTYFEQQPKYIQIRDWYIVPVLNPDGYVYSHTKDRLWRKNRNKFDLCVGVDLNRNFMRDWTITSKTEYDRCKDTYSGRYPYSEEETLALRDMVRNLTKIPLAFIDIHSYGQKILYPWSGRKEVSWFRELHVNTTKGMVQAIHRTSGATYTVGEAISLVKKAGGTALDWAHMVGMRHSYVIEARDTGRHGFLLPTELILPTAQEVAAAVRFLLRHLPVLHAATT